MKYMRSAGALALLALLSTVVGNVASVLASPAAPS
jgi:hypothetical protein